MPLDLGILANKLKRYRAQFKSTVEEIAKATGISADRLGKFEGAELQPTGDEILILADYYKCDYRFFISNEKTASFEETETLFRKYGKEFSKVDRWRVQEFLYLCETEQYLMELLPRMDSDRPFLFEKRSTFQKGNAQLAADALRKFLGYRDIEIPLDIYSDFRRIGFHLFRRALTNSNISGLFIKHPTAGKCVLINYSEDIFRQRFTAAHEACHAILDDDQDFVVSGKWNRKDLREIAANTFSAQYLVPPAFLASIPAPKWSEKEFFLRLARKIQVNSETLGIALRNLNLITDEDFLRLKRMRIPQGDKVDPELQESLAPATLNRRKSLLQHGLSRFYVQLCFDGYDQGFISTGRLGEALLVDERELTEIAELFGRKLQRDV